VRPERAYSPAARASLPADPSRVLIIGCGALARELVAVIDQAGLSNVDLTCLPATLHNRPGGIPALVRERIRAARPRYEQIFIAYADCGTGGLLDRMLEAEGVERLPGAHCYEFYSGGAAFAAMHDEDPGTFYLTDFLARNFDRLIIQGLGLDRHPELLPQYFGNYRRLIFLAQTDDAALVRAARRAARRLGLAFELRRTGYGDLATSVIAAADAAGSGAIASDGTNVGRHCSRGPHRVDGLHPAKQTSGPGHGHARRLREEQHGRHRMAGRRRWLHLVQADASSLREKQGLRTTRLRAAEPGP
jgi:hypothetical protein